MAKIEISQRDKVMLENLPKLIKGAKFELQGEVVIAAGQTLSYIGQLINKMKEALEVEKTKENMKAKQSEDKPVEVKKPKRGRPSKSKAE